MSQMLGISERTLTDWKREKFTMSHRAVTLLAEKTRLSPKNTMVKDAWWHIKSAAYKGGIAHYKKYGRVGGDPATRKKAWRKWWEERGRVKTHPSIGVFLPVAKPKKSARLAEFVGIMLGDGGITTYQLVVTLHHIDDLPYSRFVVKLIETLFKITPRVYHSPKNSVLDITLSRKELVTFCTQTLGLKMGNKVKQQVDIPDWIKGNKKFLRACVRGLVDTDGSVFTHTYRVKSKPYSYKKLAFTSRSKPLRGSVYTALLNFGLHPRLSGSADVRLDSKNDMQKYFTLVSSHNPKHLNRYRK